MGNYGKSRGSMRKMVQKMGGVNGMRKTLMTLRINGVKVTIR